MMSYAYLTKRLCSGCRRFSLETYTSPLFEQISEKHIDLMLEVIVKNENYFELNAMISKQKSVEYPNNQLSCPRFVQFLDEKPHNNSTRRC